ncbi:LGFP repeat-containing protein [Modestobacter altitudinis]|uniref:LGFP repeat-containing protein n=1 Tax=Modestobacter altitudinis TaxID=2213158 RepID=UPI00110D11BE|nr:hypothetical protein [Modestobacter altitudinis]
MSGPIRDLWARLGWANSPLRQPTADERPTAGGRYSTFQQGAVFWTAALGSHAVYGSIYTRYVSVGAATSRLGFPTSDEYAVIGGRATSSQHGKITWNAATGKTTVTYR